MISPPAPHSLSFRDGLLPRALLGLPALAVLLYDSAAHDFLAVKHLLLFAGALLLGLGARRWRLTDLTLPLLLFVAARGGVLLVEAGQGGPLRAYLLLAALALLHHVDAPREWFAWVAPPVLAGLLAVVALCAIGQRLFSTGEVGSFFMNRNVAAAGIAMMLPLALSTRARWPLLVLALAAVAVTRTKSGILAVLAALLLYAAWERPLLRRLVCAGLPLALVAGLFVGSHFAQVDVATARVACATAAVKLGVAAPWRGQGADGFLREYPPIRPLAENAIESGARVTRVHNDYLESFAEGGLPGLLAHLLLVVAVALVARRHRGAGSGLFGLAVMSLVDAPMRDPTLLGLSFLLLRLVSGTVASVEPPRLAVAAPLLALLVAGRPLLDHWRAERSFLAYFHESSRAALDRALELEPDLPIALLSRGGRADLERLLAADPHNAAARFALSPQIEAEAPDHGEAFHRETLERHDPHHARTLVRLAELVLPRDPAESRRLLEHAILADRNQYRSWLLLARICLRDGERARADTLLREAERAAGADAAARAAVAEVSALR